MYKVSCLVLHSQLGAFHPDDLGAAAILWDDPKS